MFNTVLKFERFFLSTAVRHSRTPKIVTRVQLNTFILYNGPDTVLGTFILYGVLKIMSKLKTKNMGYFIPHKHARWESLAFYYLLIYGVMIYSDQ